MKKFFSLVLALVMALSLTTVAWGAGVDCSTTCSDPTNHVAAVGTTHYTDLQEAVTAAASDASKTVTMLKDVTVATTLVVDGITLDGAGHKLIADAALGNMANDVRNNTYTVVKSNVGCTIKNLTVKGGWKGILIEPTATQDTLLENVTVVESCRGINFNNIADSDVKLTVKNSTLGGWCGVQAAGPIVFENTTFVKNAGVRDSGLNTYDGLTLNNCTFAAGTELTNEDLPDTDVITINGGTYACDFVDEGAGKGTFSITGGTFSTDVSAYVDADSGFTNNGDGTYTVAVKSANTSLYDLYEGDETLYLEDVYRTKVAAKKLTKTQVGQVAGWDIEGTLYVEITKAEATKADFYLTKANKDDVVVYLRAAENHGVYTLTGKAYDNYNEGDDNCGEWNYDPDLVAMYKDDVDGDIYTDLGATAYMLVGKTVVSVALADEVNMVDHQMEGVYDAKDKLVGVKCVVCGATGKFYESAGKAPLGADVKPFGTVGYYVLNKVAVKPADTDTKVESAETFDAGIAMYVGMSVLAAAGSVVVLKKRED